MPEEGEEMSGFKQIISIIIIVIIIIILDFILEGYTKHAVNTMTDTLKEIDELIAKEDNKSKDKSKELVKKWDDLQQLLTCYIEHDEIEKVGDKVALLEKQVKIENYTDARQSITETEFLLKHIEDKQSFSIENFF